ncbi:ATP-dependent helicase, partial [Streptomyces sp. PSKA30]|nr:ATP-dependent helicase [Streptomyces sp. PSKA30]
MRTGEQAGADRRADGSAVPAGLAAVFLPAPLPRAGRVAFWDPQGGSPTFPAPAAAPPSGAERMDLTVVRPHGAGVRRRRTPALTLPVGEALPLLVRARHDPAAHPATACWGAAAL